MELPAGKNDEESKIEITTDSGISAADKTNSNEEEIRQYRERHRLHMNAKNVFALVTALMFTLALFLPGHQLLLKAIAYGFGALAYLGELLVMTKGFRDKLPLDELFMPLLFGGLYIMLGLSYALEHHYIG